MSDLDYVVAYSGGRDSHVLLHTLYTLRLNSGNQFPRNQFKLRAIHVNHGLQSASKDWADHCQAICNDLNVPLTIIDLELQIPPQQSLEKVARERRYAAMAATLQSNEVLVTAHTLNDQAETFFLQALRGCGPRGLSGIHAFRKLGKGFLERPFLSVSKEKIIAYSQQENLQWIEDPSNENLKFSRNFLRHQIFPTLKKHWKGFEKCLVRSAQHCADTQELLDSFLASTLESIKGDRSNTLKISALKKLTSLQQQHLLGYWFQKCGVECPNSKKREEILRQMLTAHAEQQPCVQWGNYEVRRYQDLLYLFTVSPEKMDLTDLVLEWDLKQHLSLPNGSQLQGRLTQGKGLKVTKLSNKGLKVCFRKGGEKCHRSGDVGSRPLKKILQDLQVPPWERAQIPLLYIEDTLIGVGDLFICHEWQVNDPHEEGITPIISPLISQSDESSVSI